MIRSFRFFFLDTNDCQCVKWIEAVTMEDALKVLLKTEYVAELVGCRDVT